MKRREIFIELTSLLDVILIMLFVLLTQAKTQTADALAAAQADRAQVTALEQQLAESRAETEAARSETEALQQQLANERQKRTELEMKLNEMSKLSTGMAKKAAQDDFHKALRIYLNISKRKTIGKREAAKDVIMGLMTSTKLELPDDIMELLEHLDDEQPAEPRTVVNGDLVQNKHVENEIDKVEPGATGITINKKQS